MFRRGLPISTIARLNACRGLAGAVQVLPVMIANDLACLDSDSSDDDEAVRGSASRAQSGRRQPSLPLQPW